MPLQNDTLTQGTNYSVNCTVMSSAHSHVQWFKGMCSNDCTQDNVSLIKVLGGWSFCLYLSFYVCNSVTSRSLPINLHDIFLLTLSRKLIDLPLFQSSPENPIALRLENVTADDEGWYTCVAANNLGVVSSSAYLRVVNEMEDPKSPHKSSLVFVSLIVLLFLALAFIASLICIGFKKINREKLIMKNRMQTVHQWNKKVIVLKPAYDSSNGSHPDAVLIPIIKIEKQRTTVVQSANNDSSPIAEYEFPVDTNWEFPRQNLKLGETLGEGAFGRVVRAEANGLMKSGQHNVVAVKMVKEGYTDSDMASLVHEMEVMKMIGKHINIINLLGCCSQGGPLHVIVEYARYGNLKDFLKKNRPRSEMDIPFITNQVNMGDNYYEDSEQDDHKVLTQKDLISFAYQVARGMEYLASRRVSQG